MKTKKIGIIGGGLSGLVTGLELSKNNCKVTIFEKEDKVGGLARGFKKVGWQWELDQFYRHVFSKDKDFIKLVGELGEKDKLVYKRPKTSVYLDGKTYPFDSPKDILLFPKLRILSRLHLGAGTIVMKFLPFTKLYEKITVEKLYLLVGKESYNKIWKPLLKQKFGKFYSQIPLSWFWARIKSRTPNLGYYQGGFCKLTDLLVEKISKNGGEIKTKQEITKIEKNNKGFIAYSNGKEYGFDKVILTTPLLVSLSLSGNLLEKERREYCAVKMMGAAVLVFRLKNKFLSKNTYWLNILEKNWPFVAIVEHTNFIDKKHYGNNSIVYLGGYYSWDDPIFKMSKEQVKKLFLPFAQKINPSLKSAIISSEFFSNLYSQPVSEINQSTKLPKFKTSTPNLYWFSMNHIYPWDRGMNYSVKYGKLLAKEILEDEK